MHIGDAAVPHLRHSVLDRHPKSRGALGISAQADAVELISRRSHNSIATRIRLPGATWAISGTRALMLRLNRRLGPVRGSRCLSALQIRSQGRAPHIRFLRAFGVD